MKLWDYLKEKMQSYPTQTVCENDAELTFEELIVLAEKMVARLEGVRCCAILCHSEMAAAMALLSCFAAGVTALPLSHRYGEKHCNKIMKAISPDAVITDQDGNYQIYHISDAQYVPPKEKPALIMCTSGTTGTPKGAMLTEDNICTNIGDIAAYFCLDVSDKMLIARPLYHCAVLTGEFLTALIHGAGVRFYSGGFHPAKILQMLAEYEITTFCGTPTLLGMMARFSKGGEGGFLRHICVSGECLDKETGKRIAGAFPSAKVYHVYGLTEACPRVSYLPPEMFGEYADCVGIPLNSVSIKILRDDGTTAKPNEVGLLWVKGGNVMAGYYNDPAKTRQVFNKGWLCTGDLALINDAGLLQIKGRNDDLIIKAGMNIYPQEIEGVLKQDDRVKAVRVYGLTEPTRGTQIVLDIVGQFEDVNQVKQLCQDNLPTYQVPVKINLLNTLPQNGSGKIVRRKCNA